MDAAWEEFSLSLTASPRSLDQSRDKTFQYQNISVKKIQTPRIHDSYSDPYSYHANTGYSAINTLLNSKHKIRWYTHHLTANTLSNHSTDSWSECVKAAKSNKPLNFSYFFGFFFIDDVGSGGFSQPDSRSSPNSPPIPPTTPRSLEEFHDRWGFQL